MRHSIRYLLLPPKSSKLHRIGRVLFYALVAGLLGLSLGNGLAYYFALQQPKCPEIFTLDSLRQLAWIPMTGMISPCLTILKRSVKIDNAKIPVFLRSRGRTASLARENVVLITCSIRRH